MYSKQYKGKFKKMLWFSWKDVFRGDMVINLNFGLKFFVYEDAGGSKPFQRFTKLLSNIVSVQISNAFQ